MNHWREFLEQQGASFHPNGTSEFAAPTRAPYLCDLGHQALIHISGADAKSFLQGQVTCDLRELSAGHWLRGAQCNLKGRVIVSFALAQLDEENLLVRTAKDLAETFVTGLSKYAVFSRVTLAPANDWQSLGVCGDGADQVLTEALGVCLSERGELASEKDLLILRHGPGQTELWLHKSRAQSLWQRLSNSCQSAATELWQLSQINAGIADVVKTTSEIFTPQELNYPQIGAVSFKKGCYTGQEVVARLHYKGKLKKHLYAIEFTADTRPLAGCDLTDGQGKKRGQLVQAALAGDNIYRGLAVLPDEDSDKLYIGEPPQQARRLKLPYDIQGTHTPD